MGWIDVPGLARGGTTVIAAELDRGELEETTRLFAAAVARLTTSSLPNKSAHPAGVDDKPKHEPIREPKHEPKNEPKNEPKPQTVQAETKIHDTTASIGREGSSAPSVTPEALMMEKLRSGLKSGASSVQAVPTAHRPTRLPRAAPLWNQIWQTELEDHTREMILASVYTPLLDGLPGGNGHGGWLITASKSLINLWECSLGRGEPALQLMHSQATDAKISDLALERGTKLLLATAHDPRKATEGVVLHSLDPEIGMFAPKGMLPLRSNPGADFIKRDQPLANPQARQVESLHDYKGPLDGCLAASFKNTVIIYPTQGSTSSLQPKTRWEAHTAIVSQLHRSSFGINLFTGAVDGSVHRWELKAKPRLPASSFIGLVGEVTGLQQISQNILLATSANGILAVWDMRRADEPLRLIKSPDCSGITKLAVSSEQRLGAFSTAERNLYSLNLELESTTAFEVHQINAKPLPNQISALSWNTRKQLLMASCGPSVSIFAQPV